jgi:hypothetical protein
VTTSPQREPTNDQLWAQPPVDAAPTRPGQGVAPYTPPSPLPVPAAQPYVGPDRTAFVLAIVSLGIGVPLTAIASSMNGLAGLIIAWVGIVLVNVVYGWTRRSH